ncbi:MAG TPA: tryptophan 7-halogenase, partial [Planctomycetota bacterium]|nr:tryptophan 7-halogenase [Planctomycetota bacterium]
MESSESTTYDVIVLGGALAGASTALLLRRHLPGLRVLILERNPAFDWKVGESTVEISSYFLTRVLRLYEYLSR